jgi:sarcosine oxidase, subunit alpha
VAGPSARQLLARLTGDPIDSASFPYLETRELTVAGVSCLAIRLGFVGELCYELHHPSSRSGELWDALLAAGGDLGIRPHGLDALRLLRLEKGHILHGQDTDFDSTPAKLDLGWAVRLDKGPFVGRSALLRLGELPVKQKLVKIRFDGKRAPAEGAVVHGAETGFAGVLTSSRMSLVLGCGVALGLVHAGDDGSFPTSVRADGIEGRVVDQPFYDPTGERVRA